MTSRTIFANAKVILQDELITGMVTISDGLITRIDTGPTSAADTIDFEIHALCLTQLRARLGDRHERATVAGAQRYGATLASHDDATIGQAQASAAHGASVAECPTTLEAATACRDREIWIIMGAPNLVWGGSPSGNVAARDLAQ